MKLSHTIRTHAVRACFTVLLASAPALAGSPAIQDSEKAKPQETPVVKEVPAQKDGTQKESPKTKEQLEREATKKRKEAIKREQAKNEARRKAEEKARAEKKAREGAKGSPGRPPIGEKPASRPATKPISRPVKGQSGGVLTPLGKGAQKKPQTKEERQRYEADQRQNQKKLAQMQSDPGAKLQIEFGTERHDFGRLRQGDQVEHTFVMQSSGTTPLKIRQIKPSCGCTLGSVTVSDAEGNFGEYTFGDPIEPGRQIKVNAAVNTTNKKNKVQVRIQVMSNDPVGTHALTLAAEVQPFLVATPQMIQFGDIPMGSQRSQVVDVRTSRGEAVLLNLDQRRLSTLPPGVSHELTPVNPNAEGKSSHWQLRVDVGEDAAEGRLSLSFRLNTDIQMPVDPEKEKAAKERGSHVVPQFFNATVSGSGRILGTFSVDKTYMSFGLVRPGQVVPRSVRLTCNEQNFSLDNISVSMRGRQGKNIDNIKDLFEISVKPVANANAVDVELRLKGFPDNSDQSFNGEVVINTGYPSAPEKVVIFSGICRSGVR